MRGRIHDFKKTKNGKPLEASPFIEIVDPGNQFVKNLMFDGVYSSDFAQLNEDILDWFSAINERYASVYSDTEHHRTVKATIDQMYT